MAEPATFLIVFDRSFFDEDGQLFINELAVLAGPDPKPELNQKKAIEPISALLIIVGVFAVGSISNGFFNKLGADGYSALKRQLKEFYGKKHERERLVDFQLIADTGERRLEVHVIVSEPNSQNLEELFSRQFIGLDLIVKSVCKEERDVAKVVVQWRDGKMTLLYSLRTDGVPTEPEDDTADA